MCWVKWSRVLASKDKGGLGASSYFTLNRALMFKWVWRFRNDGKSLWTRFIKAMYGRDGNLGTAAKRPHPSAWLDIVNELHILKNQNIDLLSLMKKKVGNGADTLFWEEVWRGGTTFRSCFPRVYALKADKSITVARKLAQVDLVFSLRRKPKDGVETLQLLELEATLDGLQLPMAQDRWSWSIVGSGEFSVAYVRKYIDDHLIGGHSSISRWVKAVPIKINIMAWKVRFDYLPTRLNLSKRGLDLQSILCPMCNKEVESTNHIFFACSMVRELYRRIVSWWDVCFSEFSSYEGWLVWLSNMKIQSTRRVILEGVIYIMWWLVWNFHNQSLFGSSPPLKATIFDEVVNRSFYWCKYRSNASFSWLDWLKNPSLVSL
ncbi:RNA-directed DNA polymerase, eukaryota, reverse transcriptase zinc-binding domain protein [Tanacetum coccineum]